MKIKFNTLFSLMLVAAFALSACGAEATLTATPFATDFPSPTEAPTVEPPPVKFTIWAKEDYVPVLEELAGRALEKYNLEVVVEGKSNIRAEFEEAFESGTAPDIIMITHDEAGALIAENMLAEVMLGNKQAGYESRALEACTVDEKLFCLPYATENLAFFYNTSLVATPPVTWDEVISIGAALKAEGKVEYVMSITGDTVELYPLFSSFGGYIFGKDDQGKWDTKNVGLDHEGMVTGVRWLADNMTNGNLPKDWDAEKNRALFTSGQTPFIMDNPSALKRFRDAGVAVGIAKFPGGGVPLARTAGFFINAQSANILLAQAFLNEYVAPEDMMVKLYEAGQHIPAHSAVMAKVDNADLKAIAEAGANADMIPNITAMDRVWAKWKKALGMVRDGKQDPASALKEAGDQVRALIENPLTGMVNVPGSYQVFVGCISDFQADCEITAMAEGDDGKYHSGPFNLPAGDYEAKVALDGKLDTTYGMEGKEGGENYKFSLTASGSVEFVYDPTTHVLEIIIK
jgi:maltose-binding protein MalE